MKQLNHRNLTALIVLTTSSVMCLPGSSQPIECPYERVCEYSCAQWYSGEVDTDCSKLQPGDTCYVYDADGTYVDFTQSTYDATYGENEPGEKVCTLYRETGQCLAGLCVDLQPAWLESQLTVGNLGTMFCRGA